MSSEEKCNIFNQYFKKQCETIETSSTLPAFTKKNNLSLRQIVLSEQSLLKHIRKLNINKAHGHDEISVRMIKIGDKFIVKPLLIIYKNCISKGHYPQKWKMANVIPIHKKNDRNLINNYRPVSLLPICGKLFEKLIFDGLYEYIFSNKFISDKQSGYRKNDSTVKQLLSITNEVYKAFDKNQDVIAVFLDISRAFDRVWHDGLIFKLKEIGIEGEYINIIKGFLTDRKQRVVIDGKKSEWTSIESGVPQGSILGPLLFLVYINDLIDSVESDIRIFADDTFIFRIVDPSSTDALNRDLERITQWANQWKMVFNPDMSKQAVGVIFTRGNTNRILPSRLVFNGFPVKIVHETKHIGMILDEKLNFESHLRGKMAKASQGLGLLKQLKKWVSFNTLETIYKMYIRPHLDYGDMVYDKGEVLRDGIFPMGTSSSLLKRVESIQYEAARIVSGAWNKTSRDKLYKNLGWESLQNRRLMRRLCLFFEVLNTKFPNYLYEVVEKQIPTNVRQRDRGELMEIFANTSNLKLSFFPSTIRDWNSLEDDIKYSNSKLIFKNRLINKIRPKKRTYYGLSENDKVKYLTILRMDLSPLRAHKFLNNFNDTSDEYCIACGTLEDTKHFLLHCDSYRLSRTILMQRISSIVKMNILTLSDNKIKDIFLYGSSSYDYDTNTKILKEVTSFIAGTKRLETI